jgi:CRP/FNR family transcriptional regulator, cyclic AMP receptor protein
MRTSPYITKLGRTPPSRACLSDDDRRTLPPCLHTQHYRRGAFLFQAGEVADQFFWVCQGIVKLSAPTLEGGERLLNIFWPGDFFGTLWLSPDQRRVSSAQALSPVTVQAATNGELAQFLQRCPEIHTNLLQNLFDQQGRITLRIGALLNADIGERLLVILLDLAERYGRPIPDGYRLAADLTQEDIAHLVGLDRSTTSLLINRYRRDGVLGGRGRLLEIYQAPVRALLEQAGLAMLE